MKILLIGNYLPDKQDSMLRFAGLLVEALKPYNHEVKLIRPTVKFNRSQSSFEEKGKWWGYIDKLLYFPFHLKKEASWADVVHICDHSNAYYIKYIKNKPHVINCHDVIAIRASLDPFNTTIKRSGKILQSMILKGLKKAERFACISKNTQGELLEIIGVSAEKTAVIYMGVNYPFYPMKVEEALQILSKDKSNSLLQDFATKHFIFHVGGNQFYKNRMGVLRIYRQLRELKKDCDTPRLVLAGKPWSDEMRQFVAKNDLQSSVIELPNCSNQELQALYSLAQVFIFPSLAEGFGWPVIEAQSCGCPVLTSNFAPLTEIGGTAAVYCDPRNEKEAAHQLDSLLNESATTRESRVLSGLENVKRFTPQTMIEGYLSLYREAIETHASSKNN